MGCICAREAEPELERNFDSIREKSFDKKNRIIDNDKLKESINSFLTKFNEKVQYFGDYISNENIEGIIPMQYQTYMSDHPFVQLADNKNEKDEDKLKTYEIKPIQFKNGNIYIGNWNKNLKMDGYGKYYLNEENVLAEGNWDNGELKYARILFPNGDVYEGDIKDSAFHGKGKLKSYNGDVYEGDFVDMEKTGYGKIIFSDGTIYEGNVNKGEFNGKGKMIWTNGYQYEGDFKGPNMTGKGKLSGPMGDVYEGDLESNLFHGKGKYIFSGGKSEYIGDFQYGIKKGKGKYTSENIYSYDGNWDNDLPCGFGKLTNLENYSVLKSIWRNGKNADTPIYEKGTEEDFQSIDINIIPEEMKLDIKSLSHLDLIENDLTQYKLGYSLSFINEN